MTINLSTGLFYDRAASAMQVLTGQADRINQQITAQSNILAPSDNNVAWTRLQSLSRGDADGDAYAANVKLAQSVLQQADTGLGNIGDQLNQASTLVVQANSGTLPANGKAAIAGQLSNILQSIIAAANATDARGGPLFGGASDATAVTQNSDGSLSFAAGNAAAIPIGDGQTVQPSDNASRFLKTGTSDIGAALTAIIAALNSGTTIPAAATDTLKDVSDQVTVTQASIGARAARVDIQSTQLTAQATDRATDRAATDGFDLATSYADLQKTMTVLSATQASFSKLSSMSLFDYLK